MVPKYFRDRVKSLFKLNDSPHKLAFAFALGVFIAFSPTIGLHTLSCFVLAWALRLNTIVVVTAAFINNPWTVVPMYGFCLWLGVKITGSHRPVPEIPWNELSFTNAWLILKPYLLPFIVGTVAVGIVAAGISYLLFYWAIVRYKKAEARRSPLA